MQKYIDTSSDVSTNEPPWREGFVLLSKEESKSQDSEQENTSAADNAMGTRNLDRLETPQEESDKTPANCDIHGVSSSPGDEVGNSDESGEDSTPEEPLNNNSVEEVSILKRLGFWREFYNEKEVESAFIHLSLAFKSDVFTLKQRLQVEEHARDVAEENIQMELEGCKEILQKLGAGCTDKRRQKVLKELERSLQVLETSITHVANYSEHLGALHQEARVNRGMQVMIQHVENLKCLHSKEHAELQEMKQIVQQNSRNRQFGEMRDDADFRNKHQMMRVVHQSTARRRVSIAVIPKQLMSFHCPDSKMADREEPRIESNSTRLTGENGQPFDSKLQNAREESSESIIQDIASDLSHQPPLSENSGKEDPLLKGSQEKRLEKRTNGKFPRSGEASTPLTDTTGCSLNRGNQEVNIATATKDKAFKYDLNERESETEDGDTTSEDSLTTTSLLLEPPCHEPPCFPGC
ncbi:inositol 1,4,5-triphosphate receptor associated 2 isoform X2 [Narcine bancroftii]|uniref:inositol 1,4,5-triphosphate receptor associated 2 isoform X2 n=1 Tax=Narcine bancroftii TaxID=1343680 RepID=UPI0038314F6D